MSGASEDDRPYRFVAPMQSNIIGQLSPPTRVSLSALRAGLSPRLLGEDLRHVQGLAEVADQLPPILVHRGTMKVIDGAHRWRVAIDQGRTDIVVRFFEGSEEEAFLLGFTLNLQHGLPLTLEDRKSAAVRLLAVHSDWSDRWISDATGLSPKTAASLRRDVYASTEEIPQLTSRVGRDGRRRRLPKSSVTQSPGGRHRVTSPSDTRLNPPLRSGGDPQLRLERRSRERLIAAKLPAQPHTLDIAAAMAALRDDPSIRLSDPGRELLRLLAGSNLSEARRRQIASAVPPYRRALVADLAEQCAESWHALATTLRDQTPCVEDVCTRPQRGNVSN